MMAVAEWCGCGFGLLGALVLALKMPWAGYGFVAFLLSNICWIIYGVMIGSWGLVSMQIGFMLTSALGIYRWFTPLHDQRRAVEKAKILLWRFDRPILRDLLWSVVLPARLRVWLHTSQKAGAEKPITIENGT